ncbi:MAG: bifunctional diaminohydroxyphosphoribosylaminopyrimidine deaminase/5-amino-6-(5-phosphoribosylamino)uracil reductase RibD [Rhodobacteraceae bacterium]|nr:bifunctional diaminohydroxyphosphoribosylaminopyrimidine deaminase/5-amino-6-(5-phosphoribosylamino)uracil reductase RibD [Paracoccaceae bacterium]
MRMALGLAQRGEGCCWPNPNVGCVLVREGRVVGRGWTAPGGRPHAETQALARAGDAARGATAYVTLEPCAHTGKTPPCAEALIGAGVARVVTALTDPDPRVAGGGHAMLRAAGILVTEGVCSSAAARITEGFLSRIRRGRPFVTLKLATSLDGRIATASGESRWITGPEARRAVHALRARHDAVMVGIGTALADDPELTVRGLGMDYQPLRIVCDTRLRLSTGSRLGRSASTVPVWMVHGPGAPASARQAWQETGAVTISCPLGPQRSLDPGEMLGALGDAGLTRIFCEGGGQLAASLLSAGMVDRVITFSAGLALGAEGRPALASMEIARLALAPRFRLEALEALGPDICATWEPITA